ncbi:MAG TPA: acyl-CoA dehydrogenase family protein [Candidatus Binatia bacterium]|nr:acyl-CoA dehydrogenase family protein [Candidatus Binatia bacterium]
MAEGRSHDRWVAVVRQLGPAFAARAAAHDAEDSFVADNYKDLRAHRLFSAGVPVELGGDGASQAELADVLRVLATYCSSTALALSMHTHQILIPTWRWRHQGAPVEPFLRRVAAEELVLVSTGGSDWLAGSGTAEKVEGGYRITGRKIFSSGAPAGDLLMTMAVYDDPKDGPTVLHFAIPLSAPGVKVQDNWRTLGMRGTGSHDTVLDGVFVPDAAIGVRRPAGRWSLPMHVTAAMALPIVYSVYVGVAEAARGLALDVAAKRRDEPTIQRLVGEMENELTAAQLALGHMLDAATCRPMGPETTGKVLIGRTLAAHAAIKTVERAMEVAGGAGFFRSLGLERLFRDVQGARYHQVREPAQLLYAGQLALGLDVNG